MKSSLSGALLGKVGVGARKVKGGFLSLGVRAGMPQPPPIAPQDSVFMPTAPPIRNK